MPFIVFCRMPLIVPSLMASFTMMVLGEGLQVDTSDGPTPIEQALIEHTCSRMRVAGTLGSNAHQECLSAQLLSLRADLGRDLSGLSGPERKTLDAVCGDIRAAGGREAYLECLSARLVPLRNSRNRAKAAASDGTPLVPPLVIAPAAIPAPLVRQVSSRSSGLWIGAALLTVFVVAGGILLAMKARRAPRKCRVCGKDVPESGDLCQTCRHEAADAVRSNAMERADQQRAQEQEQRRQREHAEEQRRQQLQEEGEADLRQQEDVRQREEDARARADEAQQRQEEEARQRSQFAVVTEEDLDPYIVLGVPRGASVEDIEVAYQEARLKYDPDQVTHLSIEVQDHYRAKARAVDRAHQKLTE
jgi:hypothetical protein